MNIKHTVEWFSDRQYWYLYLTWDERRYIKDYSRRCYDCVNPKKDGHGLDSDYCYWCDGSGSTFSKIYKKYFMDENGFPTEPTILG